MPSNAVLFHFRKTSFLSRSLEDTQFLGECIGTKLRTPSVDFNWATIGLLSLPENGKTALAKTIMMTAVADGKSQSSGINHRDVSRWETRASKDFGISRYDRQLKG